jgi:hypothetical protein
MTTRVPEKHPLLPLGHEALRPFVPGLEEAVRRLAQSARTSPSFGESATVPGPRAAELPGFQDFVEDHARAVYRGGYQQAEAVHEANLLGHYVCFAVNFELHRRKVFWVDDALAWMLAQTTLDIEGRALKLPFPAFALVFQDQATLELFERVLRYHPTSDIAGERVRILSVYVARGAESEAGQEIDVNFVADARSGKWPYLLGRSIFVRPDDNLKDILESRAPGVDLKTLDMQFRSEEMRSLVHLVVNAILYATSASDSWPLVPSPATLVKTKARGLGGKRKARAATRAAELRKDHSSEDVFFLPGKISISQLRALRSIEASSAGGELFARFMVRGHWRRPPASWSEQHLRWIEPYWKGPDMATIIEREYRLKP